MTSLRPKFYSYYRRHLQVLDITYLAAALLFFAACWLLTKACEKL